MEIMEVQERTQQGDVYMNGKHRYGGLGDHKKWDLHHKEKQGQNLMIYMILEIWKS